MSNANTFYSLVTNNQKSQVVRMLAKNMVSESELHHALLLATSLGLLHMIQILLIMGADYKALPELQRYCPEPQLGAFQQMVWDLEAGVEPKSLQIQRVSRGVRAADGSESEE